jgi:alkanesulfonate monooxygenase SsuD/methylene tetrahydromethanopterin reductase-like flavin-dependent oxidoreductase (luciferase family)
VTTRLRLGTILLSNDFRHPVVLAHEAASLHLVSGGRFEPGIGAGWYQPEYDAAGIAFDPAGRRISRLDESLGIIKGLLAGPPIRHQGDFYRIDGLDLDVLPGHGRARRGCWWARADPHATARGAARGHRRGAAGPDPRFGRHR